MLLSFYHEIVPVLTLRNPIVEMASVLQSRVASLTHRLRWSVKGLAVGCLRSFASGSGKVKDSLADSALRDRIDAILPREGPAVIRLTSTDVYDNLAFEEW